MRIPYNGQQVLKYACYFFLICFQKIMQNYKAEFQNATAIVLRKYNVKSLRHLVTAIAENKIISKCICKLNLK